MSCDIYPGLNLIDWGMLYSMPSPALQLKFARLLSRLGWSLAHETRRYIGYNYRTAATSIPGEGQLDHMARMAPTYLFVKRRSTVDQNPCSCCILLVKKTYWILLTGIYGTLSKDGMTT